jgi:hypothetical protein
MASLKGRGDELDKIDSEMHKQFAETEQKLKDAKLPAGILERHNRFVKHYEDNMAELKGNITRVERAKNPREAEDGIEKARKHLGQMVHPQNLWVPLGSGRSPSV